MTADTKPMPDFDAKKVAEIHQHLHSHLPSESALRVKALETLLVDKGLVNPKTIDAWIEAYTEEIGPKRGASVVARPGAIQITNQGCCAMHQPRSMSWGFSAKLPRI